MVTDETLRNIVTVCGVAGLSDRETRAIVLEATGRTQTQIGEELELCQPRVCRLLQAAHRAVARWQYGATAAELAYARELWAWCKGDIEDGEGHYRPATIGPPDQREPIVDDRNQEVDPRVRPFQPEDLFEWEWRAPKIGT